MSFFLLLPAAALAASATATLSSSTTEVGAPVELQIKIQDAKADAPEVIVAGLDIRFVGTSTQVQMNNFDVTRSTTFTYQVIPQKEGTFTIPAQKIGTLITQPLQLTVAKGLITSGAATTGTTTTDDTAAEQALISAEWALPKKTAYVGEAIPAELRLYVAPNVQCRLQQLPAVVGDGFTAQKMGNPQQRRTTKDGRQVDIFVFKTALTPVKEGTLTLQAADIPAVAVIPVTQRQLPNVDDFFKNPFGALGQQQQILIQVDPVTLEIKPLPVEGRPKEFAGAIGQFAMETRAAPERVQMGDPVTLTSMIKGAGNFERLDAPVVAQTPGWRVYPPSGKFETGDPVGISGTKTFEQALIPELPQTELPTVRFVFFDPIAGRYETLVGTRIPLVVEGAAPAAPIVAAATPVSEPAQRDIQYLRLDPGALVDGFDPVWRGGRFWILQTVPLAALIFLGVWQRRRSQLADVRLHRIVKLRQEKEETHRMLQRLDVSAPEFYNAAIRVLQLETALVQNIEPNTVDAAVACSRSLDCETLEGVRRIFATHDELRYAGAGTSALVYPDQREQVLQLLAQFESRGDAEARRDRTNMSYKSYVSYWSYLFFCFVFFTFHAQADNAALYDKGDYAGARAGYEEQVRSGAWSANLFYNLGNAAYRQGEKGPAFLAYERALTLEPGHPEAQANLRFLREETGAKLPATTWVDSALAHPAGNTATWLAAVAFWGMCFCFAPLFWKRRPALLPALGCALVLLWSGAALWWQNSQGALWIVTAPLSTARTEPADNAPPAAKLPMGSHVRLLLERGPWLNVRLPDTTKSWITRDEAEPVWLVR